MALGSYNAFINSMLELRDQRLQEERYKQLERMENQKQMMDTIGNVGSSISKFAGQMGQNSMANQLMAEQYGAPPRAQAVDPSMQEPADAAAARMPGFYTGGMDELKMRMSMDEFQSKDLARKADIYSKTESLKFYKSKFLVEQAEKAAKRQSPDLGKDIDDELAVITKRNAVLNAIGEAKTPEQHHTGMATLAAIEAAAKKRGLKIEPINPADIAPFMSDQDRTDLETQQGKVAKARKALETAQKTPPGFVERMIPYTGVGAITEALGYKIPSEKEAGVLTAQQLYEAEQEKLRQAPGSSFYGEKPVTSKKTEATSTSAPAKSGTVSETYPAGTIRRSKSTGRAQKWDGTKWIDF